MPDSRLKFAIQVLQKYHLSEAAMEGTCNRVEYLEKIISDCRKEIAPLLRFGEGTVPTTGGVYGTLLDIDFALQEKCPICKGKGEASLALAPDTKQTCPKCFGSGEYPGKVGR